MDKSAEGLPIKEVERVCKILRVKFNEYDLKGSLNRVHDQLKKLFED